MIRSYLMKKWFQKWVDQAPHIPKNSKEKIAKGRTVVHNKSWQNIERVLLETCFLDIGSWRPCEETPEFFFHFQMTLATPSRGFSLVLNLASLPIGRVSWIHSLTGVLCKNDSYSKMGFILIYLKLDRLELANFEGFELKLGRWSLAELDESKADRITRQWVQYHLVCTHRDRPGVWVTAVCSTNTAFTRTTWMPDHERPSKHNRNTHIARYSDPSGNVCSFSIQQVLLFIPCFRTQPI